VSIRTFHFQHNSGCGRDSSRCCIVSSLLITISF
jgi:hypothetical protein